MRRVGPDRVCVHASVGVSDSDSVSASARRRKQSRLNVTYVTTHPHFTTHTPHKNSTVTETKQLNANLLHFLQISLQQSAYNLISLVDNHE